MASMIEPNYASYTLDDLIDCKANIDAQEWPERLKDIENALNVYVSKILVFNSSHLFASGFFSFPS